MVFRQQWLSYWATIPNLSQLNPILQLNGTYCSLLYSHGTTLNSLSTKVRLLFSEFKIDSAAPCNVAARREEAEGDPEGGRGPEDHADDDVAPVVHVVGDPRAARHPRKGHHQQLQREIQDQ